MINSGPVSLPATTRRSPGQAHPPRLNCRTLLHRKLDTAPDSTARLLSDALTSAVRCRADVRSPRDTGIAPLCPEPSSNGTTLTTVATSTTSSERRVDGRTLRHKHRRPEIVAALAEYLLDNGIADLSLRPAAAAIGVTHATLLRHFATKEDLTYEVVGKIRADLVARTIEETDADPAPDVGTFLAGQWARLTTPTELRQFVLLCELAARHGRATAMDHLNLGQSLSDDLTAPIRDNLIDRYGLTPRRATDLAVLMVAQIRGLAMDIILSGNRGRADHAMTMFLELLAASGRQRD